VDLHLFHCSSVINKLQPFSEYIFAYIINLHLYGVPKIINAVTYIFDSVDCSSGVTHVVSEHETVQQSIKALCTETSDWKENTLVLKSAWLSECIKAGRLVDVQQQHCLPLGRATSEVCNYYGFQFCKKFVTSMVYVRLIFNV